MKSSMNLKNSIRFKFKLTHDKEMQYCDEDACQLEGLCGEEEAGVDLDAVDDGEVAAGEELEAEEEGGEGVRDHQRQHEGYVRGLVLQRRIIQREFSRCSMDKVVKKPNKSQRLISTKATKACTHERVL